MQRLHKRKEHVITFTSLQNKANMNTKKKHANGWTDIGAREQDRKEDSLLLWIPNKRVTTQDHVCSTTSFTVIQMSLVTLNSVKIFHKHPTN
jgi:Tfp pilus assembly major pilin PilA